tara:strand:- start:331 stop:906 length:576 start_codon:yes stop_codon:yes gene_type:complete
MGLDISVISNIKPMDLPEGMKKWSEEYYNWEEEEGKEFWSPYNMEPFERHSEGLPDSELVYSDDGEYFSFRAGSYSGYGEWRNDLAIAAGYEGGSEEVWMKADGGEYGFPFEELINFPDNEGVIGPVVSQKLYDDFVNYEKDIDHSIDQWYLKMNPEKEYYGDDVKWFKAKYKDWKYAFDIARKNGMVIFH